MSGFEKRTASSMSDLTQLRIDGQRLWDSIMSIAEIGPGEHGGSSRLALTDEDRAAGVTSDRIGYFTSRTANKAGLQGIQLREVVIPYEEQGKQKTLRIVTNLLDVSAKTIALLYRYRWQVETNHAHYVQRFTFPQEDKSPYTGNPSIIESGAMAPALPAMPA